jgi:hypothetical protein
MGKCPLLAAFAAALAFAAGSARALDLSLDADQDDYYDGIETALGSQPDDSASTPESFAVPPTCLDGGDNDGDGLSDLDDPGCEVPAVSDSIFPAAGDDVFESNMNLEAYDFDFGSGTICPITVQAKGPTVVRRSDPAAGVPREIDVEIVAMQLSGTATIGAGAGCVVGSADVTIVESAAQASVGKVTSLQQLAAGPRGPVPDLPADSFFDVFFRVDTPLGVFPGGPSGGPAGDPVRVENTIATLPPYQGGKNPLCYQVPGLSHEHCPVAPPDHYLCYTAKFEPKFEKRDALLQDQFDETAVTQQVKKPKLFCNPVGKNGEPLSEPTGHLKCYQLESQKSQNQALVRNQFGTATIETKKSDLLCLASEKNDEGPPATLDDYKCYKAKFPKFEKRTVTLVDQFGTIQAEVKKSERFCNPVARDGTPIQNPERHLECFKIKAPKVSQVVTVTNAFGVETVTTKKPVSLCVPSSKNAEPPGGGGNGIEFEIGIRHGTQMSFVCFVIRNGPPNSTAATSLSPDGQPPTLPVGFDSAGNASGEFTIFAFGEKTLMASGSFGQAQTTFTVGPKEVPCPQP